MSERRKILVTGATGGIGRALVGRLAARHELAATGRLPFEVARDLLPQTVHYIEVRQDDPLCAAESLGEGLAMLRWDRLDNAILNAGTGFFGPPELESAEKTRLTLDVNLGSTIAIARICFPLLEAAHGRLTLIGSASRRGAAGFASYAASKAGLNGFTRSLRSEWRGRVDVQMLNPGPVATGMHKKAGHDPGWPARFFLSPGSMAAMIEAAVAAGDSPLGLSWTRYLAGGAIFARRL